MKLKTQRRISGLCAVSLALIAIFAGERMILFATLPFGVWYLIATGRSRLSSNKDK